MEGKAQCGIGGRERATSGWTKVAADLVEHFMGRGFLGKAMMVCIDKATAVKMDDRVQKQWARAITRRRDDLRAARGDDAEVLRQEIAFMEATDMAVVVSQSQNEIRELADKGVDIRPHRKRLVEEDLDSRFKNEDDPLRLVFVCTM